MNSFYVSSLIQEWALEKHSRKLASCMGKVLTEVPAEIVLFLKGNPKLQLSLYYGDPNSIWAYFPAYQKRFPRIQLRPETRVLLTVSVPRDETRSAAEREWKELTQK